jgi:hypothetical protein
VSVNGRLESLDEPGHPDLPTFGPPQLPTTGRHTQPCRINGFELPRDEVLKSGQSRPAFPCRKKRALSHSEDAQSTASLKLGQSVGHTVVDVSLADFTNNHGFAIQDV